MAQILQTNTLGTDIYSSLMNILVYLYNYSKIGFETQFKEKQLEGWKILEKLIKDSTEDSLNSGIVKELNPQVEKFKILLEKAQKEILSLEGKNSSEKEEKEKNY